MWKKPWGIKEGLVIGGGLVITGLLLQYSAGGVNWQLLAWPANIVLLLLLTAVVIAAHLLRRKAYPVRFLSTPKAAVAALSYAVVLTIIMGLVRQRPSEYAPLLHSEHTLADVIGISQMLSFWPFVLIYAWMALILALTILRRATKFRIADIPFYLNHLGLLVVIMCATLGSADMRRLKMTINTEEPEWRATDNTGAVAELPIAVQLEKFTLEEYPPRVIAVNNQGSLIDATPEVSILKTIDKAAPMSSQDSTWYVEWPSYGAVTALLVESGGKRGWLSGGSHIFPPQFLPLTDSLALAIASREPKAFISTVHIYTKSGKNIRTNIEVNKPFALEGWQIYQLSYDTQKGRWSDVSILEFVTDPWQPAVYTGIFMMAAGAICLFLFKRRKEEQL